jgi:hypothetical protein
MIIINKPDGELKIVIIGSTNDLFDIKDWVEDTLGRDFKEFLEEAFHTYLSQVREYMETGRINERDENGNIVKTYETLEEWDSHFRGLDETLEAFEELKWSDI